MKSFRRFRRILILFSSLTVITLYTIIRPLSIGVMHENTCLYLCVLCIDVRVHLRYNVYSGKGAPITKKLHHTKEGEALPIKYKLDVLEALKKKGYSTYRIRKDKLLAESTVQAFRRGDMVSVDNIARICELLGCQPGDILEYESESGA